MALQIENSMVANIFTLQNMYKTFNFPTFQLASFAILGVGIWIALENNLVSVVFEIVGQQNKMKAPVYLVSIGAAIVAVLAFAGGYAAYKEIKSVITMVRSSETCSIV